MSSGAGLDMAVTSSDGTRIGYKSELPKSLSMLSILGL
jgi:hypothetical protein